jgi:5'-nucleotidase, C-terminal domain
MKLAIVCGVIIVAVLASNPASALEPLVLYDNFNAKVLTPDKWFGKESLDQGVVILESGRRQKTEPLFKFRGLNIINRSFASTGSDAGYSQSSNSLVFADGSGITTIQAIVLAKKIQATGCSAENEFATTARVRIGGAFFNTAGAEEGNQTNDVFAFLDIERAIESDSPANVLNIRGRVAICTNAACSSSTEIGSQDMGKVKVNQKIRIRMTWDPDNNRFIFQKGKAPEVYVAYNALTYTPGTPNGGNKRLEVQHDLPNCTSAPRPMAHMEAFFDNVVINAPSAPPDPEQVIGTQAFDILRDPTRLHESAMGNMIADGLRSWYTDVEAVLINSGSLRADLLCTPPSAGEAPCEITWGEMFAVLPFGNRTVIETLTGEQLATAFINGFSPFCDAAISTGRFPQISGLKVQFHCDGTIPVIDGMWKAPDGLDGTLTPIGDGDTVRLVTNDFMFNGGDGYTVLGSGTDVLFSGHALLDISVDYLTKYSPMAPVVEGRIVGP